MSITKAELRVEKVKRFVPFPVQADVEYRLKQGRRLVESGRTQSVTLSGSAVVLNSARRMPSGMEIELTMTWPVPKGSPASLVLCIKGRTAGGQGKRTRVEIGRYNFEARGDPARKPPEATGSEPLSRVAPFAS